MIQLGSDGNIKEMWAVARVYQGGQLIWQADWASSSSSETSSSSEESSSSSSSSSGDGGYPNSFVVTGAPTNVDVATAAFNGTYTKTSQTTTIDGVAYPVYYNTENYLYAKSSGSYYNYYIWKVGPTDTNQYQYYYLSKSTTSSFPGFNASTLAGSWSKYTPVGMLEDSYTLSFTESTSTTPEAGTFVDPEDEPTTPTTEYLEVTGCSTTAMNGTYYFISGDADTAPSGSSSAVLRHANGHYYIFGNSGGSSGSRGWFVANGSSRTIDGTPAGSPYYKIGNDNLSVSAAFTNGTTMSGITTTYYGGSSSSSSSSASSVAYTVSGASTSAMNGGYSLDPSKSGYGSTPVYVNGNGYYLFNLMDDYDDRYWVIGNTVYTSIGTSAGSRYSCYVYSTASTPPTSGWTGCTVVQGEGESSSEAPSSSSSSSSSSQVAGPRIVVFNSNGYDGQYFLHSGSASSNAAVWKESTHEWYIRQIPNDSYAGWSIYSAASGGSNLKQIARNYGGSSEYSASAGADTVFDGGHTYDGVTSYYGSNAIPDNGITFTGFTTSTYNGTYHATGAEAKISYMDWNTHTQITEYVQIYSNGSAYLVPTMYMADSAVWSISASPSAGSLCAGNGRTLASLVGSKSWSGMYGTGDSQSSTGVYVYGGSGPYLLSTGGSYSGEYRLYSGTVSSNTTVWKETTKEWYVVHDSSGGYSPWYIRGGSTMSDTQYAMIAHNYYGDSYSNSSGADTVFANGYTYNGYTTTYHAS